MLGISVLGERMDDNNFSYVELAKSFPKGSLFRDFFLTCTHSEVRKGAVYLIENSNGMVKIGKSFNPKERIKCIETQGNITIKNPFITEKSEEYSKLETALHKHFKMNRVKGEWFFAPFEDIKKHLLEIFPNFK